MSREKLLTKEQVLNVMLDQTEIDMGYYYPLTEHVAEYVYGIQYDNYEWSLVLWNDHQDSVVVKIALEELTALQYITYSERDKNTISQQEQRIKELEEKQDKFIKENETMKINLFKLQSKLNYLKGWFIVNKLEDEYKSILKESEQE